MSSPPAFVSHVTSDPVVLLSAYLKVRQTSERLSRPLLVEDYVVQSMPDVSPTKWHLAHTSWFFETFVLEENLPGYEPFHSEFRVLFNSYYNAVGPMHSRPNRGLLSRPTVDEVYAYRKHVDEHMQRLLERPLAKDVFQDLALVIEVGIHHEQQHEELILTDIKHVLAQNPLHPVYRKLERGLDKPVPDMEWLGFPEGIHEIGHDGRGFGFDNEFPRHRSLLTGFRAASRLVTCGEYLAFMEDDGYRRPELWLSDGWATVNNEGWNAPLYWVKKDSAWYQFTLGGLREIRHAEPVTHVSLYEADAYASWVGYRLPREEEWEVAAAEASVSGNFLERDRLHPVPLQNVPTGNSPAQMFGDVWEWTQSSYAPYPGFRALPGALGEYNGKFMSAQNVLRGGSCITPASHIRKTYRNFFPPSARWQFSGIRLARDV